MGTRDWIRRSGPIGGVELLQAWFAGTAYAKHRHDTYAIGLTLAGIQTFDYRGAARSSTPGRVVVLYPDESHDGRAGNDDGFGYGLVYIDPARLAEAVGSLSAGRRRLPFIRDAVTANRKLAAAVTAAFHDGLEPLAIDATLLRLAEALLEADSSDRRTAAPCKLDLPAIERARQYLDAHTDRVVPSADLEKVTGLTRFALARQFRAVLATSPYRYSLRRRLARARSRIEHGQALAGVAVACGFADQAHLTRMFKAAYGLTPARDRALQAATAFAHQ